MDANATICGLSSGLAHMVDYYQVNESTAFKNNQPYGLIRQATHKSLHEHPTQVLKKPISLRIPMIGIKFGLKPPMQ